VKITNPAKGQQVVIGKNLTLSGTASYNATSSCGVFVIVDGVRPYQKTTPIGQTGGSDYSKWKYTFTPAYAGTIREGINRITAKLLCQAYPPLYALKKMEEDLSNEDLVSAYIDRWIANQWLKASK
jgi:hypothetical protein